MNHAATQTADLLPLPGQLSIQPSSQHSQRHNSISVATSVADWDAVIRKGQSMVTDQIWSHSSAQHTSPAAPTVTMVDSATQPDAGSLQEANDHLHRHDMKLGSTSANQHAGTSEGDTPLQLNTMPSEVALSTSGGTLAAAAQGEQLSRRTSDPAPAQQQGSHHQQHFGSDVEDEYSSHLGSGELSSSSPPPSRRHSHTVTDTSSLLSEATPPGMIASLRSKVPVQQLTCAPSAAPAPDAADRDNTNLADSSVFISNPCFETTGLASCSVSLHSDNALSPTSPTSAEDSHCAGTAQHITQAPDTSAISQRIQSGPKDHAYVCTLEASVPTSSSSSSTQKLPCSTGAPLCPTPPPAASVPQPGPCTPFVLTQLDPSASVAVPAASQHAAAATSYTSVHSTSQLTPVQARQAWGDDDKTEMCHVGAAEAPLQQAAQQHLINHHVPPSDVGICIVPSIGHGQGRSVNAGTKSSSSHTSSSSGSSSSSSSASKHHLDNPPSYSRSSSLASKVHGPLPPQLQKLHEETLAKVQMMKSLKAGQSGGANQSAASGLHGPVAHSNAGATAGTPGANSTAGGVVGSAGDATIRQKRQRVAATSCTASDIATSGTASAEPSARSNNAQLAAARGSDSVHCTGAATTLHLPSSSSSSSAASSSARHSHANLRRQASAASAVTDEMLLGCAGDMADIEASIKAKLDSLSAAANKRSRKAVLQNNTNGGSTQQHGIGVWQGADDGSPTGCDKGLADSVQLAWLNGQSAASISQQQSMAQQQLTGRNEQQQQLQENCEHQVVQQQATVLRPAASAGTAPRQAVQHERASCSTAPTAGRPSSSSTPAGSMFDQQLMHILHSRKHRAASAGSSSTRATATSFTKNHQGGAKSQVVDKLVPPTAVTLKAVTTAGRVVSRGQPGSHPATADWTAARDWQQQARSMHGQHSGRSNGGPMAMSQELHAIEANIQKKIKQLAQMQ